MKKIVLVYGLISGLMVSLMLVFSTAFCYSNPEFEGTGGMVLGFSVMFLAMIVNFVGIKNYRDKHNGGTITFGKAFLTGLYMCLITSTLYVVVWLIDYQFFIPDFMEKYSAHSLEALNASDASPEVIKEKTEKIIWMKEAYKNPIARALFTYMEILPLGIVVTAISALILKKKINA